MLRLATAFALFVKLGVAAITKYSISSTHVKGTLVEFSVMTHGYSNMVDNDMTTSFASISSTVG